MDSPVQDPAGQPPADHDADAEKGLGALFRKSRAGGATAGEPLADDEDREIYSDAGAQIGGAQETGAQETGAGDTYLEAGPEFGAPGTGAHGTGAHGTSAHGTSAHGTSAPGRGSPDRGITRQPPRGGRPAADPAGRRQPPGRPVVSKPVINPRLRADPTMRVWLTRTIAAIVVYFGFMIWHGWRIGLTAAVIFLAADIVFRSKTVSTVPPAARVTAAQRSTSRHLKVLQPAGYLALNARTIPGTRSVVDHIVIGPAGLFTIDSQHLDRRLPLLAKGGMLYHGPNSMEKRLDHAQQEANQAASLIGAELGDKIKARPVMVVYGPSVPWVIMTLKGIDVFEGSRVGTYFRRQTKAARGKHLDAKQIAEIYAAAARALPPLR